MRPLCVRGVHESRPSNLGAEPPLRPATQVIEPKSVPVDPVPVSSRTVVPAPSSSGQWAIAALRPGVKNVRKTSIAPRTALIGAFTSWTGVLHNALNG